MLSNSLLKLHINFHVRQGLLHGGATSHIEDTASVFVVEVVLPQSASVRHELFLNIEVPVLVIAVELKVILSVHVIDSDDTVVTLHRHILNGGDSIGDHLLHMVNFVNVFLLVPEAGGLVNKNKVLISVVNHLAYVVEINVLQ